MKKKGFSRKFLFEDPSVAQWLERLTFDPKVFGSQICFMIMKIMFQRNMLHFQALISLSKTNLRLQPSQSQDH